MSDEFEKMVAGAIKARRGFFNLGGFILLIVLGNIAMWGAVFYAAEHFIAKFW